MTASRGPVLPRQVRWRGDHSRGVDILKLKNGARSGKEVVAPKASKRHLRLVRQASRGLRADPQLGWMCPLPAR